MKRQFIWLAAAVVTALSLSVGTPSMAEDAAAQTDPLQLARGAQAWSQECTRCHNLRSPAELSDDEWRVSVTHMRMVGNIPGDRVRDIIAFLQASND